MVVTSGWLPVLKENGLPFEFRLTMASDNDQPRVPVPDYRPVERFWPYLALPEQPSDEELAALDPELSEALFGTPNLPSSVPRNFPAFAAPDSTLAHAM